MKYTQPRFSVGGHSEAYANGWDRVFGPATMYADACDTCEAALLLVEPRKPDEVITCNGCRETAPVSGY
jgi:hypothetical protein